MDLPVRCIDLTPEQVANAIASKEAMGKLLAHMAKSARPGQGAPKILVPIARLATSECEWLEGGLTVTISGDQTTRLVVAMDLGVGMRELLFPRMTLEVPRAEFVRAIKLAPALVHPLMTFFEKDAIVLTCDAAAVGTVPPPAFEIAEASIRRSLPPAVRRSLPPLYSDLANLKVEVPDLGELDLLGRAIPGRPKMPTIDELSDVDDGWTSHVGPPPTPPAPTPAPRPATPARRVKIVKKAGAGALPARAGKSKAPPRPSKPPKR